MRRLRPEPRVRQAGFTLIELLVTMFLGVLVLSVVGGIMISATTTQNMVAKSTEAHLAGELVTTSLQTEIRASQVSYDAALSQSAANATFRLTSVPSSSGHPADQLLVALVVRGGAQFDETCVAWYYSAAQRTIRFTSSANPITAPTPSTEQRWSVLAAGVSPVSGTTVFASVPNATLPSSITLDFTVDAANSTTVPFHVVALSRTGLFGSTRSCY